MELHEQGSLIGREHGLHTSHRYICSYEYKYVNITCALGKLENAIKQRDLNYSQISLGFFSTTWSLIDEFFQIPLHLA